MTYRAEIDGLRAIAVSLVLLFHFFPASAGYGYVGVDLFFVISGYVITRQILPDLLEGSFSFAGFFARRIRRILPLVFCAILVTLAVGALLLLPTDFTRLTRSAFAVGTFWSNIFFWQDGGYFGGADKLKPLLHMWSLSVEEQFYIVFPAVLWLLARMGRRRPGVLLAGTLVISLVSLAAYAGLHAIGGATPAFFLMPSRVWQFGIGACLAILMHQGRLRPMPILAATGMAGIILSGTLALPAYVENLTVAAGGALFIAFAGGSSPLDRLMSAAPLRYLGTRSFSLYVWHWPIVAYLNYALVGGVPLPVMGAAALLCLAISEASYRLVEQPFRRRFPTRASFGLITATVVASLGVTAAYWARPPTGLMSLLAREIQTNFRCELSDLVPYGASRACLLGDPALPRTVAIIGNSHAQMYAGAFAEQTAAMGASVILVPLNGCMPTTSVNISSACLAAAARNLAAVLEDDTIRTVVIGTTYPDVPLFDAAGPVRPDAAPSRQQQALSDLIDILLARKDRVMLIGPIAIPGEDLPSILARSLRFGLITETEALDRLSVPRGAFDVRFADLISAFSAQLGPDFLRPDLLLCDESDCHFGSTEGSYFADSNHLGQLGIETVRPMFAGAP
jgi:peptidoglycan/LPS O-acetylase OafA/YrhL